MGWFENDKPEELVIMFAGGYVGEVQRESHWDGFKRSFYRSLTHTAGASNHLDVQRELTCGYVITPCSCNLFVYPLRTLERLAAHM